MNELQLCTFLGDWKVNNLHWSKFELYGDKWLSKLHHCVNCLVSVMLVGCFYNIGMKKSAALPHDLQSKYWKLLR